MNTEPFFHNGQVNYWVVLCVLIFMVHWLSAFIMLDMHLEMHVTYHVFIMLYMHVAYALFVYEISSCRFDSRCSHYMLLWFANILVLYVIEIIKLRRKKAIRILIKSKANLLSKSLDLLIHDRCKPILLPFSITFAIENM